MQMLARALRVLCGLMRWMSTAMCDGFEENYIRQVISQMQAL